LSSGCRLEIERTKGEKLDDLVKGGSGFQTNDRGATSFASRGGCQPSAAPRARG
jgi:hypothetical protein